MLSDSHYESARDAARDIGKGDGTGAASWYLDGNTGDNVYRHVLAGIVEGDPEILDTFPSADLSGQWRDDRTPATLAEEIAAELCCADDVHISAADITPEALSELCDEYETAFNDAAAIEIERMARYHLSPDPADVYHWYERDHVGAYRDRKTAAQLSESRNGWTSEYDPIGDAFNVRTPEGHTRTYRRLP